MIIRLSKKLSAKIKEPNLPSLPPASNPFLDWHAHLFTCNRAQYIMVTNSTSLFSVFMHGAGVTDYSDFISRLSDTLKEVLHGIGADLIFARVIAPGMREVRFAKSQDRRVIGSMNDSIFFAKDVLGSEEINPYDLSLRMKDYIHLSLEEAYPVRAFLGMKTDQDSQDKGLPG
jgi:hypothetical protein